MQATVVGQLTTTRFDETVLIVTFVAKLDELERGEDMIVPVAMGVGVQTVPTMGEKVEINFDTQHDYVQEMHYYNG